MQPNVTNVREQNTLGANGRITKSIVLTYYVGTYGPFTLITDQVALANGVAAQAMQVFANSLALLPTATSS